MEVQNVVVYKEIMSLLPSQKRFYKIEECNVNTLDITTFLNREEDREEDLVVKTWSDPEEEFYPIITTFYDLQSKLSYIIFTNQKYDNEKKLILYALKYNEDVQVPIIESISIEYELIFTYKILDSLFLTI